MYSSLTVALDERAIVSRNRLPIRALGPGRHFIWGFGLSFEVKSTRDLVFDALPEARAVLPLEWYREVTIGPRERGVLSRRGRPVRYLAPGSYLYWLADESVKLDVYDISAAMPDLTSELVAILPGNAYVSTEVPAHARGLVFVAGRFDRVIGPGRFTAWLDPTAPVSVRAIDVRRTPIVFAPQELMTKDKVTLRLTLTAAYTIEDVAKATLEVADVRDALYVAVQLAVRDYVAGVTLDALLEGRDALTRHLEAETSHRALVLGVKLDALGVKDIVLPGEMKTLLNRVIEAEKEAAANVILRREEAAATRLRANSAKIIAEQPVLMRLTELEALKEMAAKVAELKLFVGADGLERMLGARDRVTEP